MREKTLRTLLVFYLLRYFTLLYICTIEHVGLHMIIQVMFHIQRQQFMADRYNIDPVTKASLGDTR